MKKNAFKSILSFCLVPCTICVATSSFGSSRVSLESLKEPSFSQPINALVISLDDRKCDFAPILPTIYLMNALAEELSKRDIEYVIEEIEFHHRRDPSVAAHIAKINTVMNITVASCKKSGLFGGGIELIYDVDVFDTSTNETTWRARINASAGRWGREKWMRSIANVLINRLSEEKLIGSEPKPKGK